ncbi:reverse transcriptase domain-containing protein [Sphingopyxis sp.]|uniref:reverse transcriptase domain-containing protein n=1 Tax=Sphingopyxis sp. TaxID=1908224 RepID=UPI002DEB66DB|nr:reverse transcriptase domain-containing protein [Sphingopyxis sp.]
MRSDIVEKRLASILALSKQGKRINGLFRLLACTRIWEQAYEDIASNQGALTPGVDPNNTLSGFSLQRVERIIAGIMDGSYRFAPVRRLYIPKPDGRQRPLGIPTADDKLVQAAVKIILEHVYEPIFSDRSHGFRKGRSCHSALEQIRYGWSGVKWLVEVDVSGFFDNVDHDILLNLLRKRIDDERLIGLIGRMLKAGYMEDWRFHRTFSGTPQGGVISPILANIYLHALDEHMEAMKAGFDKGKRRRSNPEWEVLKRRIEHCGRKIERRRRRGDETDIPALMAEIGELKQKRRDVPFSDWFDPDFRRLTYCRYADDFLIGVIGSKADARAVMEAVQTYLNTALRLDTSPQKTGIRKASKGAAFLGYNVRTHTHHRHHHYRQEGKRTTLAKVASDRVQLHAPIGRLVAFAERNRLGSYYMNKGSMRPEMCNHSDLEIIIRYNAMMRGLAEYYKLGTSWRREISRLYHVWWRSLINTLARKHKCSAAVICQKLHHRDNYGLWYEGRTGRRFMRVFALKHIVTGSANRADLDRLPSLAGNMRTDIIDRLKAKVCEACGADDVSVEVHHARRLNDVKHRSLQVRVRAARKRKRVVLCVPCHHAHHAGRLIARLNTLDAGAGAG